MSGSPNLLQPSKLFYSNDGRSKEYLTREMIALLDAVKDYENDLPIELIDIDCLEEASGSLSGLFYWRMKPGIRHTNFQVSEEIQTLPMPYPWIIICTKLEFFLGIVTHRVKSVWFSGNGDPLHEYTTWLPNIYSDTGRVCFHHSISRKRPPRDFIWELNQVIASLFFKGFNFHYSTHLLNSRNVRSIARFVRHTYSTTTVAALKGDTASYYSAVSKEAALAWVKDLFPIYQKLSERPNFWTECSNMTSPGLFERPLRPAQEPPFKVRSADYLDTFVAELKASL